MEDGDLGTWDQPRILLVLEDCLAHITGTYKRPSRGIRKLWTPYPGEYWEWAITTLKTIQRYSYNSVPVEVITFTTDEVAEVAAKWFNDYDVEVAGTAWFDLHQFQKSLVWRRNGIQRVIDTDPERLLRYGQLGQQIVFNGEF